MFESFLGAELTKRIGTPVEIALSDGLVEELLLQLQATFLLSFRQLDMVTVLLLLR
ncbi:hypothetical protein AAAC51_27505 [Priestia megaterium]